MSGDPTDYKQVGRDLYEGIRRLSELLRQYESQQWPPATPERFDPGLSSLVADPEWRRGGTLSADAQKTCAAALLGAGMTEFAARRFAEYKRDEVPK